MNISNDARDNKVRNSDQENGQEERTDDSDSDRSKHGDLLNPQKLQSSFRNQPSKPKRQEGQ